LNKFEKLDPQGSVFRVLDADSPHVFVHSQYMTDFISFKSLKRSTKPNAFLLAPVDFCLASKPDKASPFIPAPPDALFRQVQDIIANQKRWGDVKADPTTRQIRFIAKTPLMGFKDDVDIQVIAGETENTSTIAIYSRSRVGYSDLGANHKRVDGIMTQILAQ